MIKKYNKLVRDKIPQIIESNGNRCSARILEPEEYLAYVDAKLDEELAEYHAEPCLEELADLLEAVYAAAEARGYSRQVLEQARAEKEEKRGAFRQGILLTEVESMKP